MAGEPFSGAIKNGRTQATHISAGNRECASTASAEGEAGIGSMTSYSNDAHRE
jgi:hypothetical protein